LRDALEWKPERRGERSPIAVLELASSRSALVVLSDSDFCAAPLGDFLRSHRCFGKGMACDRRKLRAMFSEDFEVEDLEVSRLRPHDLTTSFSGLVDLLVGPPMNSFKDKRVSCSDWSARPLSVQQVLYAAFDAYAMHLCFGGLQRRWVASGRRPSSSRRCGPWGARPMRSAATAAAGTRSA